MDILFRHWARQHRRLSAGTVRRRFHVSKGEAQALIAQLLAEGVLHPRPEADSYRVRYPKVPPPERWHDPRERSYSYSE